MARYDTETKPALRALTLAVLEPAPLPSIKDAIEAAAGAGATHHELIEAVGGVGAWNGLVRAIKNAAKSRESRRKGRA